MGLDMYLTRKVYVGAHYSHRKVTGKIEITVEGKPLDVELSRVSQIVEQVGYWRKANAVHAWFVTTVQAGEDECQESDVSRAQLMELRALCESVIASRDATLLPPQAGFFFGSTEVDSYYFDDLRATIEIIDKLPSGDWFVYHASW